MEQIDYSAFKGCTELESITFPRTITRIDEEVFDGCVALKNIYVPAGMLQLYYHIMPVALRDLVTEL